MNIIFNLPLYYDHWQARVIRHVHLNCGSRQTEKAIKLYLTTAVHHSKSTEIQQNCGPCSVQLNFEQKAQLDGEQLSKLNYEIKYWTYSVWHIEGMAESKWLRLEEENTLKPKQNTLWFVSQFGESKIQKSTTAQQNLSNLCTIIWNKICRNLGRPELQNICSIS